MTTLQAWSMHLLDVVWSRGITLAIAFVGLLLIFLAYQVPLHIQQSLTIGHAPVQLIDTHIAERTEWGTYEWQRWTRLTAAIVVPDVGQRDVVLRLRFYGGSPDGTRALQLRAGPALLTEVPVRSDWQDVWVVVPASAVDRWSGDLILDMTIPPLDSPGDRRDLGVALQELEIIPGESTTWPPFSTSGHIVLTGILILWSLRLTGLSLWGATVGALGVLLLATGSMTGYLHVLGPSHMRALVSGSALFNTAWLTFCLSLIMLFITQRWGWKEAPPWAVTLRVAVLFIFAIRFIGMIHPVFTHVDHHLRLNQLIAIAQGRAEAILPDLEQQHEWGTREPVPYSLFTYYLLVPLTWIWDSARLLPGIKAGMALIDASIPLLFWAILWRTPWAGGGAAWAAVCYAAMPIGFLYFHDGSFPTTIGVWVMLLALVAIHLWYQTSFLPEEQALLPAHRRLSWLVVAVLIAAAIAAYITHIVFVPLLFLSMFGAAYWLNNDTAVRRTILWLGGAFGVGLLLAWISIYGSYTLTLVQQTIPAYIDIFLAEGSVGRNAEDFFGTPPKTFTQHMFDHFRTWPVILAGGTLVVLALTRPHHRVTHLGIATGIFVAMTSLIDMWFGLWNKHMYFAYPGIALLAGLGLLWISRRGQAGRWVCIVLIGYLFWESLLAWSFRVFWFNSPLVVF